MIGEGTKRFDLYDFFSVFLPGATFTLGLAPLFPVQLLDDPYLLLAILLVGGFVTGRWFHAFSLKLETYFDDDSHRDIFQSEIEDPTICEESTVNVFYDKCTKMYGEAMPPERPGTETFQDTEHDASRVCDSVYALIRSAIHMDSRGRSRTFQAILDFYRGAWAVSVVLALVYLVYAVYLPYGGGFEHESLVQILDISPDVIMLSAFVIYMGTFEIFDDIREGYRKFYVQYLIADFLNIVIEGSDTG